ncbi:hypothetical protein BH09BAC5_BH09BAC5_00530 [soil metagenome]
MKFNIQHSAFKIAGGIICCLVILVCSMAEGCIQNAEAKNESVKNDSACNKGKIDAKQDVKDGKYSVFIPDMPRALGLYGEEMFYVYYHKEVHVKNADFPNWCGTMMETQREYERCYSKYMDSIVQSFEWGVFQRISNGADSLYQIFPDRYHSDFPGQPYFPGGDDSLQLFIRKNIHYPAEAKRDSVQGTVYLKIEVDSMGKVSDLIIVKSVRKDLDSAVISGFRELPDFIPLTVNGKRVSSSRIQPIRFVLK